MSAWEWLFGPVESWDVVHTEPMRCHMQSLLFNKEWTENGVLVVEKCGDKKRAFVEFEDGDRESVSVLHVESRLGRKL